MHSRAKKISAIVVILFASIICVGCLNYGSTMRAYADGSDVPASDGECENKDVIFSYMDVFNGYYDYASKIDDAFSEKYSFNDFVSGYYDSELNIEEYTAALIDDDITLLSSSSDDLSGGGADGTDAYYILKESCVPDKDSTPWSDFAWGEPVYNFFDYSLLEAGDELAPLSRTFPLF